MTPDDVKAALRAASSILAGRGGPWAGAQAAAQSQADQMRGQLEDEAVLSARADPRYSPQQALDIETTNPLKVSAMDRQGMRAAPMAGVLTPAAKASVQAALTTGVDPAKLDYLRDGMRNLKSFLGAYESAGARGVTPTQLASSGEMGGPIRIEVQSDGTQVLTDGRHRLAAALQNGAEEILARLRAFDASTGANDVDVTQPLKLRRPNGQ